VDWLTWLLEGSKLIIPSQMLEEEVFKAKGK
jgi:hypothetical protein